MEMYDTEKATRVWQRVRGSADTVPTGMSGLQSLIAASATAAAYYQQLQRRFSGSSHALLQKMANQERSITACLKGICTLVRGAPPALSPSAAVTETTEAALRKCYRMALQAAADYDSRSSDGEYGQVFSRLAAQKHAHCTSILELLGKSKDA